MPTITVDFETVSAVDLLAVGHHRYAEDPTTAVIVLDIRSEDGRTYEWDPSKPVDVLRKLALDPHVTWEAHNAGFEKAIWRKVMMPDYGLPDIPNERWVCTMAACAYKAIPQALDNAAITLRLGESKDAEGSKLTIGLSKMDKHGSMPEITPAILVRVHAYCGQDNAVEAALGHRVGRLPPSEQAIWLMDQARNERGVQIDVAFAIAADKVVEEAKGPLLAEHAKLTGGLKPTQREKVMDWLGFSGLTLPDLQRETVADILGINDDAEDVDGPARSPRPELPEDVRRVLEIRYLINSTSIAKLKTMLACVCADGRARGLFNYHGTGPGRSTSKLLQLQNFPRGTIKDPETGKAPDPEKLVQAIMTGSAAHVERTIGPAIECVSSALRHALIAKDGHVLMAGDYAGIQARVVLALAGQYDKVAVVAAGADIYCDMATSIYRRKITKEADPAERQVGKNCFGAETLVLTNHGAKRIVSVTTDDLLWDGIQWVNHSGLVFRGRKKTIRLSGVSVTPEHPVLVDSHWLPAAIVAENEGVKCRALATGSENLPSPGTSRETYGSSVGRSTAKTNAKLTQCKSASSSWNDVYDLANAGPRHRFTILTDSGPLIVHNCVLGLGFGMGAGKFHDKYGEGQELAFNEEVVRIYRKEWAPNVPRLWYGLMDAAALAVHTREAVQPFMWINRTKTYLPIVYQIEDGWLSCKLPSGRKIWYWNPQPTKEPVPWDADDIRLSFTYQATKQGRLKTIHAFGGLLTENVVMGIERDIMAAGELALEEAGFPTVMNIHDEVVCEVPELQFDVAKFNACMLQAQELDWVKQLRIPIAVETWPKPVKRYRK